MLWASRCYQINCNAWPSLNMRVLQTSSTIYEDTVCFPNMATEALTWKKAYHRIRPAVMNSTSTCTISLSRLRKWNITIGEKLFVPNCLNFRSHGFLEHPNWPLILVTWVLHFYVWFCLVTLKKLKHSQFASFRYWSMNQWKQ